jgi:hypothetical protein
LFPYLLYYNETNKLYLVYQIKCPLLRALNHYTPRIMHTKTHTSNLMVMIGSGKPSFSLAFSPHLSTLASYPHAKATTTV